MGIDDGLAVMTKLDLLEPSDPRRSGRLEEIRTLLALTTLASIPIVPVSAVSGEGMHALRTALAALMDRLAQRGPAPGGPRLAVDRVFSARGRGVVVTGSLRGGAIARGQSLRLEPGGRAVRVREVQVHGSAVETTPEAGRVALNLATVERGEVARGMALVSGPAVHATTHLLVSVRPSPGARLVDGATVRIHLATAETLGRLRLADPALDADASGGDDGDRLGVLILAEPIPAALDDRFVLRRPSPAETIGGGRVLDPAPAARLVRRRLDIFRLAAVATVREPGDRFGALVAAHGVLARDHAEAVATVLGSSASSLATSAGVAEIGGRFVDPVILAAGSTAALAAVVTAQDADPVAPGIPLALARSAALSALRRAAPGASLSMDDSAAVVQGLVERGEIVRDGDRVRLPGRAPARPAPLQAAMERLVVALTVATPPSLTEAARSAACSPECVRALEADGRIVRVESDLAYATATFDGLEGRALAMARHGPLTPAAFRDATGTSRRYALAILEELDGRGLLRRTPDGHVLGPRAPSA
jgi:selenocysteine-specific elongation factor